jgi:glutamyl-Q tRNA(Asp) synthetase
MRACVGRFAPSPTGPLHFGSLVAALGSFLDARAQGGRWLLRIEDVDEVRTQPGATSAILATLEACGFEWDGEVEFQSRRTALYRAALERLTATGDAYPCSCSRSEIAAAADVAGTGPAADGARIYPGTCREGLAPGRTARAMRVRTNAVPIEFQDRLQGPITQSVEREVGDFVLLRADGYFAYQLAVVIDDAEQGVTEVVRGTDLIDSTARQIHLQRLLGLPALRYLHLPVATNAVGEKLSKQTGAAASDARALAPALAFLGHAPPASLARAPAHELLAWAVAHWDPTRLPLARTIVVSAPAG